MPPKYENRNSNAVDESVHYNQAFLTNYTKIRRFKTPEYQSVPSQEARRISSKSKIFDLRTLIIILVFILDQHRLHDIYPNPNRNIPYCLIVKFEEIDPIFLCDKPTSPVHTLLPLVHEITSYSYYDTPNYEKLRHLLRSILLDQNKVPQSHYDFVAAE